MNMNHSPTNTLYADASFIEKYKLSIELDETNTTDNVYFAGDCIQGGVRIPYAHSLSVTSRLDIHLSCTFQPYGDVNKKLFKVLVSPCPIVIPNNDYVVFSLPIPLDIPSSMKDKTLPGATIYKIKVIHEMTNLPISLYPKQSVEVTILDRIVTNDPMHQSTLTTEKELKPVIPKDMITKNKAGKGINDESTIHCRLSIPTSCFIEGQNIPISLHIQHIAPVKQMEGIQIQLERIVNFITKDERSVETLGLSDIVLPLICDVDDYSSNVNSHITIPTPTTPTLHTTFSPLQISYRIKATINLDINNLLEESTTPSRKRDIAKGMVNSWSKRIGWTVNGSTTGVLPDSIVELELPLIIGTIVDDLPLSPLPNDNQSSIRSTSSITLPPKLPARPSSISSLSSCPVITLYQNQSLTSSPIGEKGNWANILGPGLHNTRSITDPFSLIDYNNNTTTQQYPSAPQLEEIERSDIKGEYGRSRSTPPQSSEKYSLTPSN